MNSVRESSLRELKKMSLEKDSLEPVCILEPLSACIRYAKLPPSQGFCEAVWQVLRAEPPQA